MDLHPAVLSLVDAVREAGGRVYMVGGTLRDFLLGKASKDLDLLVTGLLQDDLTRLLRRRGRVQRVGQAFGVLKFLPRQWDGSPIDVALPRVETSTGVGHRDFEVAFDPALPVETDLARRDFTINAMALDLLDERLIDPFGGHADLNGCVLRQVSPRAFPEDPLRMLRGVQFASRFGLRVEPQTRSAMSAHAASIRTVAPERIAMELQKLFQAPKPSHGFVLMHEVGLLPYLFPEIDRLTTVRDARWSAASQGDPPLETSLFGRGMRRLDAVQQGAELIYRGDLHVLLAALWLDCRPVEDESAGTWQAPLRWAAALAQECLEAFRATTVGVRPALVAALVTESDFELDALTQAAGLRRFAHRLGCDEAFMVIDLRVADRLANHAAQGVDDLLDVRRRLRAEIERGSPLEIKDLAVNGSDLRQIGVTPGPAMGRILNDLLHDVLDDPARNTREVLLAAAARAASTTPRSEPAGQ
jgi:tRNA nucleotidyltransferase/poly(A) polymerase